MAPEDREKKGSFVELGGVKLVYEPGGRQGTSPKKHPCADCTHCQYCSDSRCSACRGERDRPGGVSSRKLSIREQICLFDKINQKNS
jgi:hypothetical protein